MKQKLAKIRAEIDALDQKVVRILNTRLKCAQKIGELKRGAKTRIYVAEREADDALVELEVPHRADISLGRLLGEQRLLDHALEAEAGGGVGIGPTSSTSTPAEDRPASSADSSM